MRVAIDRAGRIVIPRALRTELGITEGGLSVIPLSGSSLDEGTVRALRHAGER